MTTYYLTTDDFQLAYEVLDMQPNHVYKTDEKGIYYLLKSIIDDPDNFIEYFDKDHFINLSIDTDLKKIVKIAQESLLSTGFDEPENFHPPGMLKTEPKEETKENPLEDLKNLVTDETIITRDNSGKYYEKKKEEKNGNRKWYER